MVVRAGEALLRRLDGPEDGLFPRLAAARDLFDTEEAFQQVRTRQRSPHGTMGLSSAAEGALWRFPRP